MALGSLNLFAGVTAALLPTHSFISLCISRSFYQVNSNFGAIGQIMKMLIVLSVESGHGKINFGLNGSHIEWGPIIFASLMARFVLLRKNC